MQDSYQVPSTTRVGHIHLKVANLERSLSFYRDLLGFRVTQYYGSEAAFLSAGDYHHHIGLNTWQSKGAPPSPKYSTGLFHVAFVYDDRRDLAVIVKRLLDNDYTIDGASDHGVSEAIYLRDPDNNGVELYWDKPQSEWPGDPDGSLSMITQPLDLKELLSELG